MCGPRETGQRSILKMDNSELRALVFEALRRNAQTHFNAIESEIKRLSPGYQRRDSLKLQEVIFELLVQGVLAPGKNSLNLQLPFVHLTEYGTRCLEEDALLLHDPDDYLEKLARSLPSSPHEIVLAYVRESLLSFLSGRYLAAMVLLGSAAERSIDLLIDAYLSTLTDKRKKTAFKKKARLSGRSARPRFETLKEALLSLELPAQLNANLGPSLEGLFTLIRYSQTDAGYPVVQPFERETVHAQLLLFPQYGKHLYALIQYLQTLARKTDPKEPR